MYCPQITLKFAFGSLGSYVLSICMMLSWIFCQSWFYFDWRSNRHLHCRCCLFGAFRYRNLIRSMTSFGFFQSFVMFFFLPFCFSQPWWPMSNIACQQRAFQPFRQTTFTWGSHVYKSINIVHKIYIHIHGWCVSLYRESGAVRPRHGADIIQ